MEQKSLEKATELLAALLVGEPVEAKNGKNTALYEAYHESGEVSDALDLMLKKLNLRGIRIFQRGLKAYDGPAFE